MIANISKLVFFVNWNCCGIRAEKITPIITAIIENNNQAKFDKLIHLQSQFQKYCRIVNQMLSIISYISQVPDKNHENI
jgi:hypothetical protein